MHFLRHGDRAQFSRSSSPGLKPALSSFLAPFIGGQTAVRQFFKNIINGMHNCNKNWAANSSKLHSLTRAGNAVILSILKIDAMHTHLRITQEEGRIDIFL